MTEVMREVPIQVLTNPAFAEGGSTQRPAPMVIYIVKPEDRLWDIAKKYHTTVDSIKNGNHVLADRASERVKRGDKLLLVKAAR